jgi:ribonucleoside-diphosphate reductase alpha chain
LHECWGAEFEALYARYEAEGRARRTVKAQDLWFAILDAQIETGTPYLLYKDAANRKSNQQNLGTIKSSNLCTEIIEYTATDEVAVCNLASLALPRFVNSGQFDHQKLYDVTYEVTKNLNKIIDHNYYPVEEARNSNLRHRPIGIGVQGLADAFILLRLPFECDKARQLNKEIFRDDLLRRDDCLEGSGESRGALCQLRRFADVQRSVPVRSLGRRAHAALGLVSVKGRGDQAWRAQFPAGGADAYRLYFADLGQQRMLRALYLQHLCPAGAQRRICRRQQAPAEGSGRAQLWNDDMKNKIIFHNGSIQAIDEIPQPIKDIYKTVWEIKQRTIIDMAADGAPISASRNR